MRTTILLNDEGAKAIVANTLRADIAHATFNARMPTWDDLPTPTVARLRRIFIAIAAFTVETSGLDWQPPPLSSTADQLVQSFEALMLCATPAMLNKWSQGIDALLQPNVAEGAAESSEVPLAPTTPQPTNTS